MIQFQHSQKILSIQVLQFSSVQLLSQVWLFETPWFAAHQASLSFTNSWSLFKLISIESVMPSNHLFLCCPLLLLPSIFPSIRVFSRVQLSHPYLTTGKIIALTTWNFVGTICSDFGAQKIKVCHCFHCFPIYLSWSDSTPKYTQILTTCCRMEEVVKCCLRVTVFHFHLGMEIRISNIKNEYCLWWYWIFQ